MPEFKAGQSVRQKPLTHEHQFADLFAREGFFLDGIPLDELRKHVRSTKKYRKAKKQRS
ncbi:hypothetical protein LCL89_12420 [Halobacillus yeomjeoni]|uniref:Uncharacterized protein n=1 Tax=Halobacillus yeomjeoni TaxID=311194 RepID=A0A931HW87_9BACI|nr:hypothetical protein [Halobacillus yeomjeoni]MBH0230291.1 hypothetical protein [Halobacillus yeomjeoni]MCA0984854.1 hypothetical protein [Halobacillus yeomjeoni]